jgi:phosphate/sulfate permease
MWELRFTVLGVIAALITAALWIVASLAEVPAPPETSGVGGLVGGYLIGLNPKGKRIELTGTIAKQSLWNSRAAFASAITAVFGACAAVAHILSS